MRYVVDNYAKIVQSINSQNFKKLFINNLFAEKLLPVIQEIKASKR